MDTLTGKKIGFIGGGRMGEGIFSGILKAGLIPPEDLYVADIVDQRLQELQEKYGLNPINSSTNEGIKQLIDQVDVVFLAVLPQVAPKLLPFINQCLDLERHYVFSIMGGVLTSTLEETLTQVSLVRIMPNTPMSVCAGCAGIVPGKNCKPEHKAMALEIFNQIGLGLLLPEPQIDPLTGISGCGPAFCGIMIQALADGGVYLGLSRADAIKIAAQTWWVRERWFWNRESTRRFSRTTSALPAAVPSAAPSLWSGTDSVRPALTRSSMRLTA